MKSLGKISILFLFLVSSLYGGVSASISPRVATIGDMVTYSLKVDGSDATQPSIYQLCGHNIISSGSRTNIEMIGTDYKKTYTYVYQFIAQKSCTIDPVEVDLDGKIVKSNSVKLEVRKQSAQVGQDFLLEYNVSKMDPYVGESITLTLLLKQKQSASLVDSKFLPSDFKGLWKKSESKPSRSEDGEYILTKVKYILTPQREGNITISAAQLRVASRVNSQGWSPTFMPQVQWKSYFSNEITLDVKPLPHDAKLIGDFTLNASVDKTSVNPNEAVNVVVKVEGSGNLEDIESFKPHIDGVNIFDEKSEIQDDILTQKLVFVGDHDFTIKPFELTFFDTKTKELKTIQTQPIDIKVHGSTQKPQQPLTIKKDQQIEEKPFSTQNEATTKTDYLSVALAFIFGVLVGIIVMILKVQKFSTNEKQRFSLKDEKLLLVKLLPYKDGDKEVREIVEILEKNLYSSEKEQVDKVKIKEIVKKYGIS
ncbi:BatD family protein [Sulfurimonas marina]|uniref:Protein BatD n=1 Tax=Sulfurimonas marina TaxID=2590551 RepID=A0A7M1AW45_9BACT|nr:BatD family protein [Sulfurimonas marina]QOP41673.1 protein BatD [Sulfurimonas marina]